MAAGWLSDTYERILMNFGTGCTANETKAELVDW